MLLEIFHSLPGTATPSWKKTHLKYGGRYQHNQKGI
jgi:hypothetical protein